MWSVWCADQQGNPHPRVIYIPGEYCVHPRGEMVETGRRQFRLSYGFEPSEQIVKALDWMRRAIEEVGAASTASARD